MGVNRAVRGKPESLAKVSLHGSDVEELLFIVLLSGAKNLECGQTRPPRPS